MQRNGFMKGLLRKSAIPGDAIIGSGSFTGVDDETLNGESWATSGLPTVALRLLGLCKHFTKGASQPPFYSSLFSCHVWGGLSCGVCVEGHIWGEFKPKPFYSLTSGIQALDRRQLKGPHEGAPTCHWGPHPC